MATDDDRCEKARRFAAIDAAFRRGDLDALRCAVEDPGVVPNGVPLDTIGPCLVYAIYHSPITFIRALLELGADPKIDPGDGFPPVIAALSAGRPVGGFPGRPDVDEIVRLLLAFGADPNQRGINDYTPLHMAVAERHLLAVHRLLAAGADPELRTRIDECETPREMALAAGLTDLADVLERRGRPVHRRLRSGLAILMDVPGTGAPVIRHHRYRMTLRTWLNRGEPVRQVTASGPVGVARLEQDGEVLVTEYRIDRRSLINGLFYGIEGMRVGGTRQLEIAPHLAYGEQGVPGVIPPNAVLRAEVTILSECETPPAMPPEASRKP